METDIYIKKEAFSKDDINLLTYEILPKDKKGTLYASLIFFLLIPIMPFLPARITSHSLIQSMSYEKALLIFTILNGLVIFGIYYVNIVLLNRDINEGYKYSYKTKITNKIYRGSKQFEIIIAERPKNITMKFLLNNDDCSNWVKNDTLEITFLKRTGKVLSFRKIDI